MNLSIKRLHKALIVLFASFTMVLCVSAELCALPLTSDDVARLVQQSPTLEELNGDKGVIWKRDVEYTQDKEGNMVRSTSIVALCDPKAPVAWLSELMFVPCGGRIELEQLALFDPGTSRCFYSFTPNAERTAQLGYLDLDLPEKIDDVYVLVLRVRQYYPKGKAEPGRMEDFQWLSAPWPVWEGSLRIRLLKEQKLFYYSSSGTAPVEQEETLHRVYSWFYFKQPANSGGTGLLDSSDPFVMFSLRQGVNAAIEMMADLERRKWKPLPKRFLASKTRERAAEKLDKEQVLAAIEKFWFSDARIPVRGVWRSSESISPSGPWTTWEAMYMLAAWLRSLGWKAQVCFQSALTLDKTVVSTAAALSKPVLRLSVPGSNKNWYYIPGQPDDKGHIPVALRGKTLYSLLKTSKGDRIHRKPIAASPMSKNRLTMSWKIGLNKKGLVAGTLDLKIRNRWVDVFESLSDGGIEQLKTLFHGLESWLKPDTEMKITSLGSEGFHIVVPVEARSTLEGPNGVLIGIPSLSPESLSQLAAVENSSMLKFPFIVDQNYVIQIPSGYRVLTMPSELSQQSSICTYGTTVHMNYRRNILEYAEKLVVADTSLKADDVPYFKRAVGSWGAWHKRNLALVSPKKSASKSWANMQSELLQAIQPAVATVSEDTPPAKSSWRHRHKMPEKSQPESSK